MPITVECDNCFRVYNNVPDAAIGKAIKCKDCGERIVVRRPSAVAEEPADLPPLPTSRNAQRVGGKTTTRGKRPSSKRNAKNTSANGSAGSNFKYIAIAVLGFVISVGGIVLKKSGRIARAINRNDAEQAEPAPPTVAALVREAKRLDAEIASKQTALTNLSEGDDGYIQTRVDLSSLQNRRRKVVLSTIDVPGGSTAEADDELLELRREAFAEDLSAKRESRSVGSLLNKMTTDEYRNFETDFRTLRPGAAARLASDIPFGIAVDDQQFLGKRKETWGEILKRYPQTSPMGAAVTRMTLSEYRDYELQVIKGQETASKQMFALAFRLKPDEIEIDETGVRFPDDVHDGIVSAFRKGFEEFVNSGAKTDLPANTQAPTMTQQQTASTLDTVVEVAPTKLVFTEESLPQWTSLEPTSPELLISWETSLEAKGELKNFSSEVRPTLLPGPFLIGTKRASKNTSVHVFDIRTGAQVTSLNADANSREIRLSPDAKTIVTYGSITGGGMAYRVYDAQSNELRLTIASPQCSILDWIAVVRQDRLATIEHRRDGDQDVLNNLVLAVYDLASGVSTCELAIDDSIDDGGIGVSPDGHYLVAAKPEHDTNDDVFVFDLEEGRAVAKFQSESVFGIASPTMAFSHDGRHLAVLSPGNKKRSALTILETDSGTVLHNITVHGKIDRGLYDISSVGQEHLQWFPDMTALLIGKNQIIDVDRGREILRMRDGDQTKLSAIVGTKVRKPVADGVLTYRGKTAFQSARLEAVSVDFDELRTLADTSADDALLQLGQEISIEITNGKQVAAAGITDDGLEEAVSEAAEALGFRIADNASMILRLTSGVSSKTRSLPIRGVPGLSVRTGTSVPPEQSYEIAWIRQPGRKTVWKWPFRATIGDSSLKWTSDDSGDNQRRVEVLMDGLSNVIRSIGIPTMISKDGKSGLPANGEVMAQSPARR